MFRVSYRYILKTLESIKQRNFIRDLRLRSKGYNYLKNQNKIRMIRDMKGDCAEVPITGIFSQFLFQSAYLNANLAVRQYLLQTIFSYGFERKLFEHLGDRKKPFVYPLPDIYSSIISGYGIQISIGKGRLLWHLWILKEWFKGMVTIAKVYLDSLARLFSSNHKFNPDSVYFHGLSASNLPNSNSENKSYDIFTWFLKTFPKHNCSVIYHTVKSDQVYRQNGKSIQYLGKSIYTLNTWRAFFLFHSWLLFAILFSFISILLGRWWNGVLFGEFVLAKVVSLKSDRELCKEYLFHYSLSIYRPLWTYEVENRGSKVICYFYSGFEHPKVPEGYVDQKWEFRACTWPNYFVWDRFQQDLVQRELENPKVKFSIVGPIWFETSNKSHDLPKNTVCVFDFQQHRKAFHLGVSPNSIFFNAYPNLNILFLSDIQAALAEKDIALAYKKKRNIGKRSETRYKNFMKKFENMKNVILIDPEIPALSVIEKSIGTISLPFTSTALFRREENFPSIYYDPTGWVDPEDRASHGIPIIQGKVALSQWINENFEN